MAYDFSYFKYMGSRTSPPCEEYVVWFVARKVLKVGTTTLTMLKRGLKAPSDDPDDVSPEKTSNRAT